MLTKIKKILLQHFSFSLCVAFFIIFNFKFLILGYPIIEGPTKLFQYPVIFNLKEKLNDGVFPFYSEKVFSGYPIYQNPETAYLNPLRIFTTLLLPFEKVLPFEYTLFFIFGLIGYFKFLREKKISDSAIFFSHFIYFYSLQFTQKLGNITYLYALFLVPLTLYFIDKIYSSTNSNTKKKYILLNVFVTSICMLYGSYSSILILLSSQLIYVVTEILSSQNFKFSLKYFLIFSLLCFSTTLFSVLPAWDLYTSSTKDQRDILLSQGTISPILLSINFLTPFTLGDYNNFIGQAINPNWKWTEVHSYAGLAVIFLVLISFIGLRHLQFKKFFIVSLSLFLILAFFSINLFGMIFILSLSLIFASITHHLFNFYEKEDLVGVIKNISILLIPATILVLTIIYSSNLDSSKIYFKYLLDNLPYGIPYFMPSLISSFFLIGILVMYRFTRRKAFIYVLPIIAVTELLIFSQITTDYQIKNINLIDPELSKITSYYKNQRVTFDTKVLGSETLYYQNWNVYGFSSFVPKNYSTFMYQKSLNTDKFVQKNYYLLDNLGVYRMIDVNNNILATGETNLFSSPFTLINSNENYKKYEINVENAQILDTKIRFDQNIEVFVNSQKIENPKVKDIFYSLDLNQGINTIEFIYNPRLLYFGIVFSLVSSIIGLVIFKELNV